MEHLANFLASDNAMLAAFIGAYISLFIYMIHRMDKIENGLRKEIRDSSDKHEVNHQELSGTMNSTLQRVVRIETLLEMKQSDAGLTYPIPPDRSSLHDAASGVAEPPADNARESEPTNRSDDQV